MVTTSQGTFKPKADYVKVYVWKKGGPIKSPMGHAAIGFGEAESHPDYVSFNPSEGATMLGKLLGNAPEFHDLAHDRKTYGGNRHFCCKLYGLNFSAMREQARNYGAGTSYGVVTPGYEVCSSVVADILEAGGGDKLAGWSSRHRLNIEWTPEKVKDFAMDIANTTKKHGSVILQSYGPITLSPKT